MRSEEDDLIETYLYSADPEKSRLNEMEHGAANRG